MNIIPGLYDILACLIIIRTPHLEDMLRILNPNFVDFIHPKGDRTNAQSYLYAFELRDVLTLNHHPSLHGSRYS